VSARLAKLPPGGASSAGFGFDLLQGFQEMNTDFDVPSNWYESFFTAPVNRFWEAMVPPEATAADLRFIVRHIGAEPPRLLDVPCGAGRHALALARIGHEVTGVDLSEDAIDRAAASAHNLPARFIRADMLSFPVGTPFDGALCLGNSLGYFGAEGLGAFLARLAAALRPGARLILDSYTCAESVLPLAEEREIAFDGGTYEARLGYDVMTSTLRTEAKLALDGETHLLRYAHHILTCGEMVRALAQAGLATLALYADTDERPYEAGSPRLLLVAARE
jgi:cyclopropane fatty-acyl-phospholipid synthase-like methyltransferase